MLRPCVATYKGRDVLRYTEHCCCAAHDRPFDACWVSIGNIHNTEPMTASIGIGSVSLFTGVLSTLGTFFAFAKKQEGHRIAAIQYAKLGRFISIELALPREERIAAGNLLKMTKENIERLLEIAPPVPDSIVAEFNRKFAKSEVAQPDICNGVHKVVINV